jgi:hypothetical protein
VEVAWRWDAEVARQRVQTWEERWEWEASRSLAREFPELREALDDAEWSRLLHDLLRALGEEEKLARILWGWYCAVKDQARPEYAEHVRDARAGRSRRYSSEELKEALGL